jgi:hypothetical protein
MKTKFSSASDCIHTFAQRIQSEGRASNVFFINNKIYSYGYHYLLGEFIDEKTIVINDKGYSSTTSKHIHLLTYGARQYKQFFSTKCDIGLVYSKILLLKDKLAVARKPENYINEILYLFDSLNEYIQYRKDKNTPKDVRYKAIKAIVKALNVDSVQYQQKLAAAKKKDELAKKRKEAKRIKEALTKWYNYEVNSFRIGDTDYLRLSKDGLQVETSQNVRVEVDAARSLYESICKGVDIKDYKIAQYKVTSINGTLKIGCHNINMESVHKVGKLITVNI